MDLVKRGVATVAVILLFLAYLPAAASAQDEPLRIGFVPPMEDPFYRVMESGVDRAAADLGVDVVTVVPEQWGPGLQTPIIDGFVARRDIDCLITVPTHAELMVSPLRSAADAGISVVTLDLFVGDGDYVDGPVTFPISYVASDNVEGGRIAARVLAMRLDGAGATYIQNTAIGVTTTEERSRGFREGIAEFPGMEVLGEDYNHDDVNLAIAQTSAKLQAEPDLRGIFGVHARSARGAAAAVVYAGLQGEVQVIAFDATQRNIEQLEDGVISLVVAQKPYDMGFIGVQLCAANVAGVTSLPARVKTGFAVIDAESLADPDVTRHIYQVP